MEIKLTTSEVVVLPTHSYGTKPITFRSTHTTACAIVGSRLAYMHVALLSLLLAMHAALFSCLSCMLVCSVRGNRTKRSLSLALHMKVLPDMPCRALSCLVIPYYCLSGRRKAAAHLVSVHPASAQDFCDTVLESSREARRLLQIEDDLKQAGYAQASGKAW